jgi:uncharacterized membrane protein SirB2
MRLFDHLDDILIFTGCVLILIGVYLVSPVTTWFVAGGMCIVLGVLAGLGGRQ